MKNAHTREYCTGRFRCPVWRMKSISARASACVCVSARQTERKSRAREGSAKPVRTVREEKRAPLWKPVPKILLLFYEKGPFYRQNTFLEDILYLNFLLCARARCLWRRKIGIWVGGCWTEEDFILFHFWGENSLGWCQRREKTQKRH